MAESVWTVLIQRHTVIHFVITWSVACRVVIDQQIRHVVAGPGVATQIRTCFRHHACLKKRFPSISVQVSNTCDAICRPNSTKCSFEKRRSQSCRPSSSFFTVLPESFCCRSKRYDLHPGPASMDNWLWQLSDSSICPSIFLHTTFLLCFQQCLDACRR